ncbi:malonyl-CoA/methylmalonyl-CoA synthetase [Bradyrhizobium sp. GM24.11]
MKHAANANLFSRLFDGLDDPKRLAIETQDGAHISYGDLIARAGQMANVLVARGVKPGDRVAVQVEKSVANIVLYLGSVRAGAVYLPLNTAYTLNELDYFIGDAEPSLVVCDPAKAEGLAPIAAKVKARVETLGADGKGSLMDAAEKASSAFTTVPRTNDDLAAILYTSGTTGRSKGAVLTHDNLASNSLSLVGYWRFTDKDVLIHALPIYHTHGLFVATNVTLFSRASMIFLPKLDPDLIIKLMARATVLMGVPTFYTRLLQNSALSRETTKHMRLFISGSAPLLAETHREWSARTGHAVLERYGMTETNMNTSNPYDGERVPGAVGFPLPGVTVRVTEPETGKELPREEIGMIEVKGPNVFKGYWRMPEKTKSEFRPDGFFITGDLGKDRRQGLCPYPRPRQGSRDLRRLQRLPEGDRERDRRNARRDRIRRHRRAACRFRRGCHGRAGLQQGRRYHRRRGAEGARRTARQIQDAQARLRRRRAAAQHHGQGAEERAAGYVQGYLREEIGAT